MRRLASTLWPYVRPYRKSLALAYLAMLTLAVSTAAFAVLSGPALTLIFYGSLQKVILGADGLPQGAFRLVPQGLCAMLLGLSAPTALAVVPVLIIINACIKGISQLGQFYLMGKVAVRATARLRQQAFARLLQQPPAFFLQHKQGDLLSRLSHDATAVEHALFYGLAPIVRDALSVACLLIAAIVSDPMLAALCALAVPAMGVPLTHFSARLKKVATRSHAAQGDLSARAHQVLLSINVVQAHQTEAFEAAHYKTSTFALAQAMQKSYWLRALRTPVMEIFGNVVAACVLYGLGLHVARHQADPGHYISFFLGLLLLYEPIKKLGHVGDYIAVGTAASDRLLALINAPSTQENSTMATRPWAPRRSGAGLSVELKDVYFRYRQSGAWVLNNLSLRLQPNETVAVVGRSGAGKSTLANVLPRFYDIARGTICIDGRDTQSMSLDDLRRHITVVFQDVALFDGSVRDNIAYGHPSASDRDVEQAAKRALAHDFVVTLPDGYHTVLGERGLSLSGGQRQRLALARAFLRDTPLLILDEPTSQLDASSQNEVQRALIELAQGRTTLIIAHRLASVRHADHIAVMDAGRLVDFDTPSSFAKHDINFAQMLREEPKIVRSSTPTSRPSVHGQPLP